MGRRITCVLSIALLIVPLGSLIGGMSGTMPVHMPGAHFVLANPAQSSTLPTLPGGELITYVRSAGIGRIAVRVEVPEIARYPEGAPIVVEASTWFVPKQGFHRVNDTTQIGAITVSYLWPEREDPASGARSEGTYDYGGPDSLRALRDVIRFASGLMPNVDGHYISALVAVTPITDNVGLFASSHAGVVATNVLAHHGAELPTVKYLIGRENPTRDELYPLEIGHFDDQGKPVFNPYYTYPDSYSPTALDIDYSTVGWIQNATYPDGRPFFAVPNGLDYVLSGKGPTMWDKRYFSMALTQALSDNNAFAGNPWPADLATVAETQAAWPFRITVHNYPKLATVASNLKVMLVFAADDHVQAAPDKPHIHQAYDGFRKGAGLWVRMNPDRVYVEQVKGAGPFGAYPDNDANTEPADWMNARQWGFPNRQWRREDVWLASVAEMADRVRVNNWNVNLDTVLFDFSPTGPMPTPTQILITYRLFLPIIMKH